MMATGIEHIGIAVRDLDSAVKIYEKLLGVTPYRLEEVIEQKVRTAFFMVGSTKIELLESTDPSGPIAKFIEKRGEGIHHIALSVPDVKKSMSEASKNGFSLTDPLPRAGAEGLMTGFIHPKSTAGVLIELCSL